MTEKIIDGAMAVGLTILIGCTIALMVSVWFLIAYGAILACAVSVFMGNWAAATFFLVLQLILWGMLRQ